MDTQSNIMDFHDSPKFLGNLGVDLAHPPKVLCTPGLPRAREAGVLVPEELVVRAAHVEQEHEPVRTGHLETGRKAIGRFWSEKNMLFSAEVIGPIFVVRAFIVLV